MQPGHMTPPAQAPGRKFLLVCGILYAVFGGLGIIGAAALQTGGAILGEVGLGSLGAEVNRLAFLAFIASGIMIVAGVLGIAWKDKLEKAQVLIGIAVISIAFDVISSIILGALSPMIIISLALPTLFIVGAVLNKNALSARAGTGA